MLLLCVAGLLWFVRWLVTFPDFDLLSKADQLASVFSVIVGALGTFFGYLSFRLSRTRDPVTALDAATEWLGRRLRISYEREAAHRQLQQLGPLKVRWKPVGGDVISKASQKIPGTGGDLDALAAAFTRLGPRQLVITGSPMSGKSSMALLLALTFLRSRETDGRLPVVLSVSTWNPRERSLSEWLIARLTEEHPELTLPKYGKRVLRDLIEHRRVLPVLDGFDELSEDLHDAARERLVEATASGEPFIVTVRTESYLKTVRAQGKAFGRAAVVRLRPVTSAQAIAALTADDIGEVRRRWEPVEQRLKNAKSPLARVLSNPLMVYLARLSYAPRDRDPAELTRFRGEKDIVRHLYDSYLPALYRNRYDPLRVRKWLGLLAHHLDRSEHSENLAWWRLAPLVPRAQTFLILVIALIANFLFFLQYGLAGGIVVGFVVLGLCRRLMDGQPPRQMSLTRMGPRNLLIAVTIGVAAGGALLLFVEPERGKAFAVLVVATVGIPVTLIVGLALSLRLPATTEAPRAMLANDRIVLLGVITLVGLAAGVRSAVQYSVERGLVDGLQMIILVGLLVAAGMRLGSGWLTFGIARIGLCLRWGFPWRLLTFLEDAHRRGVLRRSGPYYQFRHADLQRYLAATHAA